MRKRLRPLICLGLLSAARAHAEAGMEQLLTLSLEELMAIKVRISTNTDQPLMRAPSVVSVITAEDIKATGATNLIDVLQSVPGVYIRENLFGFRPFMTFRGASSGNTLLMVNGAPIKELVFASGMFWRGLPTSMIERVEIIRGPGSALFGSDAGGGVINVITKTAGRIAHSEAGVRAGSFNSRAGWLQHGTTWNGFDIGVTAEVSRTDGHDPFISRDKLGTAGNVPYGWNSEDFRLSLAKGHWRLHADYMRHGNLETGLTGAAILDPVTRGSDHRYNLDLFYDNAEFASDWGVNAELRYLQLGYSSGDGFQEEPPTGAYPDGKLNRQRAAERRLTFELSGLYTGIKRHALRLGGGGVAQSLYRVEHDVNFGTGPNGATLPAGGPLVSLAGTPYAFAPEKIRQIRYLFLQDVWTLADNLELTAGARYDHYSDFGGTLNPRLALVWQTSERLTSKLMYGEAFRAPSYLELYSNTAATIGNPGLKPEKSNTWDLAFSFAASKELKLGLDFYRFEQTDVIGQDAAFKYQNIGSLVAQGVEMEAQWQATRTLRISGNLSDRREDYSSLRTFNVPKQKAYLRADWAFLPNWSWNVQANWVGRHLLPPSATANSPVGAYAIVDTTLRYAPGREWEFAASIRNLLDRDAREYVSKSIPGNLPLPGRSVAAEMRFKF